MNLKRFINKCKRGVDIIKMRGVPSYAQAGEDVVVNYLFTTLGINKPSYLEIGTNQPILHNNTYFFYNRGSKGVCIEPDIEMFETIKKARPNDTILNIGIGLHDNDSATFYLFPGHLNAWSTFSAEEAIIREKESGLKAKQVIVKLKTINNIIDQYFDKCPNYISLDVEGLDLQILESLDFDRYRPDVICVETISFSLNNTEEKLVGILDFMETKNYFVYADTHINTIFCRKELFNSGK